MADVNAHRYIDRHLYDVLVESLRRDWSDTMDPEGAFSELVESGTENRPIPLKAMAHIISAPRHLN